MDVSGPEVGDRARSEPARGILRLGGNHVVNMAEAILETRGLTKEFSGIVAIDKLSTSFQSNKLYSIIGPNGAGKTTFFNLITCAVQSTEGEIFYKSENITNKPPHEIARGGIIRSYQVTNLFDSLSVLENARIAVQAHHNPYNFWREAEDVPELRESAISALEKVDMAGNLDRPVSELSHGEQRMLEIAVSLCGEPEILLLDEPTSGMSQEETTEMIQVINDLASDVTVLLVEHKMSVVTEVSDEILVLHNGQKLASGDPETIQNNDRVKQVYLGA